MAWLLDTNIRSEPRRPKPEQKVVAFVADCPLDQLFQRSSQPAAAPVRGAVLLAKTLWRYAPGKSAHKKTDRIIPIEQLATAAVN